VLRYGLAVSNGSRTPRQALIVVPLAVIAAVPAIDPLLPPVIHLAPILVLAPAVTATFAPPRRTALIGALAVVAHVIAGLERSVLITERSVLGILVLMVVSAFLVFFSYLRERHERELVRVRSVSEATQRVVLRPLPEQAGPVSIASAYRAAEADTQIGGDLYAVARTADSTRLLIGDVRGKGLASISETATILESFRAAAQRQSSLPEMVVYLEESAQRGLKEFSGAEADVGERFVTAAVVDIPDGEPVARLIVCGHPPPLLLRQGAAATLTVRRPAPPLGLGGLGGLGALAGCSYVPEIFPFAPGDLLLLYTDGVTEARDEQGIFYPLAERAAAWADCAPAQLIRNITADLRAYVPGALGDDMAMIAVQRKEPAGNG
jgi:serine phosphatase RsbU (regulator of sigma subunit)